VKALRQDFIVRVQTELSDLLSHLQFIDESGLHLGLTRLYGRAKPGERVTEGTLTIRVRTTPPLRRLGCAASQHPGSLKAP